MLNLESTQEEGASRTNTPTIEIVAEIVTKRFIFEFKSVFNVNFIYSESNKIYKFGEFVVCILCYYYWNARENFFLTKLQKHLYISGSFIYIRIWKV